MNMTARTIEYTDIQGHLLSMSTGATCLTRIGWIDFDQLPASFFRFAGQFAEELRPRGICNALRKTMVMGHSVNMEVFNRNHTETVYDLPTFLVREVIPSKLDTLVNPCYYLTVLATFRGTLRQLTMFTLHFRQSLFFFAEKAGIGYLFPIAESS